MPHPQSAQYFTSEEGGEVHHFVKTCMGKYLNSLRVMFLNMQLKGNWEINHLQPIIALKNLEKFLHLMGEDEGLRKTIF